METQSNGEVRPTEFKNKIAKFREYLDYVDRHYDNVQKAWKLVNDKCGSSGFRFISDDFVWNCIDQDVKDHDLSKLSEEEFTQYRQYFFPTENETKDKKLFLKAWDNHKEKNLHHWQSWTAQTSTPYDDAFVVMMAVDWIAMGFEFGDTARDYYEKNKENINIPEWSVILLNQIFDKVYDESFQDAPTGNISMG